MLYHVFDNVFDMIWFIVLIKSADVIVIHRCLLLLKRRSIYVTLSMFLIPFNDEWTIIRLYLVDIAILFIFFLTYFDITEMAHVVSVRRADIFPYNSVGSKRTVY